MADLRITTITGVKAVLQETAPCLQCFDLHGELLTSNSAGYDEARAIWNATNHDSKCT
jgi:hypothetical protein